MPQRFGLYEDLSVQENLDLYANLRGLAVSERPAAFDELLTFTDLKRFTARLAGKLSGGMKQKLGLACALLKKPRLLLLDEPSVGVDPISRRELWKMVQDLKNDGVGVLWSTAYLDEAEACDRVLLLDKGKLLFAGRPSEATARVEGRVYKISGLSDRRAKLVEALDLPGVIDGVIQGEAVRLVLGPGADAATLNRLGANGGGDAAALRGRLHRHAGRRAGRAFEAGRGFAHDQRRRRRRGDRGRGAHQAVWRFHRRKRHHLFGAARRDLRPPRAERRRQVDDVQDAVRPAAPDRRDRAGRRVRSSSRRRQGAQPARLHGAEILALRRPHGDAEPRFLRRRLWAQGRAKGASASR